MEISLKCRDCDRVFKVELAAIRDIFNAPAEGRLPHRCPSCADEQQGRPEIVLSRETLFERAVSIDPSFVRLLERMTQWTAREDDLPCWRLTLSGKEYGANWNGRIEIYSHADPKELISRGECHFTEMLVTKRRTVIYTLLENGRETIRRVLIGTQAQREGERSETKEESSSYVVLSPNSVKPSGDWLVFAEAHTKTTLKGFGRQYRAHIDGDDPLWYMPFTGGYRSSRAYSIGWLAIVSERAPICVRTTGDICQSRRYPHVSERMLISEEMREVTGGV